MAKRTKIWTTLGVAVLAGAGTTQAGVIKSPAPMANSLVILADGEGGGEGSGTDGNTTYALQSTDADAYTYDASPQIAAYVDLVARSYETATVDAGVLATTVDALLASPSDAALETARKAWIAARPSYLHTEAFRFYNGPIDRVEGEINAWPLNEAYIDYVEGKANAGIVNDTNTKLGIDMLEGSNQKQDEADVTIGWHAIEFLLWGQDLSATGTGNRPYTDYVSGTGNNDRRREYLKIVTAQLVKELGELSDEWKLSNSKSYAAEFKTFPQREAMGRIINGMAILAGYEFMSERFAVALDSGDQEDEQSCFSDNTKQDFVHDLVGLETVWRQAKIRDLMASRQPALAKRVDTLFAETSAKVNLLGDPWDKVLATPKGSVERNNAEAVIVSLQALADSLKDVGNNLGVLVLIPTD